MALSEEEINKLRQLRGDLIKRTGPDAKRLEKVLDELDLTGISTQDLKSILNSRFTQGINIEEIDTSGASTGGKFTSTDMNKIAPGSLDVTKLKAKISNQSMLQGRVTDIVDTQAGTVVVSSEVRANADVEDVMEVKTKSQGTNLQFINRSRGIDNQAVANKPIKSRFLEE